MTEQEAIEQLKNHKYWIDSNYGWIDDVCDMAIEALEKQIPKKPAIKGNKFVKYIECPNCQTMIRTSYCPECGQAIDWSDYD